MIRAEWRTQSPLVSLALGTTVIVGLVEFPFVGLLVLAVIWLMGAGSAIGTGFGIGKAWSLSPLAEDSQS